MIPSNFTRDDHREGVRLIAQNDDPHRRHLGHRCHGLARRSARLSGCARRGRTPDARLLPHLSSIHGPDAGGRRPHRPGRRMGEGRRAEDDLRRLDLRAHGAAVAALHRTSRRFRHSGDCRKTNSINSAARPTRPDGNWERTPTAMSPSTSHCESTSGCRKKCRGRIRAYRLEHCTVDQRFAGANGCRHWVRFQRLSQPTPTITAKR